VYYAFIVCIKQNGSGPNPIIRRYGCYGRLPQVIYLTVNYTWRNDFFPTYWKEVDRLYTHNLCVISPVVQTFVLDIVVVGFLQFSYHIPSMTCKVMEAYERVHLCNSLVYELEHITKKRRMCVIKDSISQPGWYYGSKVEWNNTDRDNRMGYKRPFLPLKVTATCNILNHTPIYFISLHAPRVVYHHLCSHNMSTNGSPPKTANMAALGVLFGTRKWLEDNSEPSENTSRTGIDRQFGKHTNQHQPPHMYGYPPWQQQFPGTLQFYHHSPFNVEHSSQPTTSVSQRHPSHGPQWQGYELQQGG